MMETKSTKLDKNSEYYRECPECNQKFMADHLLRRFCKQKCHDTYHNRTKRLERQEENFQRGQLIQTAYAPKLVETPVNIKDDLKKNIEYLSTLPIEPNGTTYNIIDLERAGFIFSAYEGQFPLDKAGEFLFLQYGIYKLYLIEPDKVLIALK